MSRRTIRIGITACVIGFFLVFFLPALPWSEVETCSPHFLCLNVPGGIYTGYQSMGHFVTGWGAYYSSWFNDGQNWGGYVIPTLTFDFGDGPGTLTPWGVLFTIFIPAAATCAWLLGPELRRNRISRIGFAGFGSALYALGMLFGITMLAYEYFRWEGIEVGLFYGLSGLLMVLYATRNWPFENPEPSETLLDTAMGKEGLG